MMNQEEFNQIDELVSYNARFLNELDDLRMSFYQIQDFKKKWEINSDQLRYAMKVARRSGRYL